MADNTRPGKEFIRRHTLVTRLTHWLNVLVISLLLMSGLQIFNAHPALYWGEKSTFADPWLAMTSITVADVPQGITSVGDYQVETTGLFGFSGKPGAGRAFRQRFHLLEKPGVILCRESGVEGFHRCAED